MLDRTLLARDETSRFFHHNNRLAETWESLTQKLNGEITGQVNGQIMEFNMTFSLEDIKVEIQGIRQMRNINAGRSTGFAMQKNIIVTISGINNGALSWKIYQRQKLFDLVNRIVKKFQILDYDNKYALISSELIRQNETLPRKVFEYLAGLAELRSIEYKKSVFRIEYFNLLGANTCINLVKTLSKIETTMPNN